MLGGGGGQGGGETQLLKSKVCDFQNTIPSFKYAEIQPQSCFAGDRKNLHDNNVFALDICFDDIETNQWNDLFPAFRQNI